MFYLHCGCPVDRRHCLNISLVAFPQQSVVKHWNRLPRRLWMPHPWRHSRPGWMWLWAAWSGGWRPCSVERVEGGGLKPDDHGGPFQPRPFYDSVSPLWLMIFCSCSNHHQEHSHLLSDFSVICMIWSEKTHSDRPTLTPTVI